MISNHTAFKASLFFLGILVIFWLKELFFKVKVPTGSMLPNIRPGDHIIVRRLIKPTGLRRGDLVVFRSTERQKGHGNLLMIKRLIGLPGERIQWQDQSLVVDGKLEPEQYVHHFGGKTRDFKVPEHSYLFLGDNRKASNDARYWQDPYVRGREITGKALFRIWPLTRIGILK